MSKKIGIVVSLVLALVFTMLIANASNKKYTQATRKLEVAQATEFIPVGTGFDDTNTKIVEVVESAASGLAGSDDIEGKAAKVPMVKGQYIYRDAIATGKTLKPGCVEVVVPVDLSSSAYVMPGHKVNVHIISKETQDAPVVLKNIQVIRSLDNQGEDIGGGNEITNAVARKNEPAAVGLEIPEENAPAVVYAASQKMIYLTKSGS